MSWIPKYGRLVRRSSAQAEAAPAQKPAHPLDHDADGRKGGSKPKAERKPKAAK